jgi:hypothetical protein
MLKDTRALVAQAANQGKSADQMKQDHVLLPRLARLKSGPSSSPQHC